MKNALHGIGAVSGITVGSLYTYSSYRPQVRELYGKDPQTELCRYAAAKEKAERDLRSIYQELERDAPDKAEIFTAHMDILTDEEMTGQISAYITQEHFTAENAVHTVYKTFAGIFEQLEDPLIRERKADVEDVAARLLRILEGAEEKNLSKLPGPVIVAARDLLPSDTATMDKANIMGLLTEFGNVTSHTAIIARNYNIPAILGIPGLMDAVKDGETVAMDAESGEVYLRPDEAVLKDLRDRKERQEQELQRDQSYLQRELTTADGTRIMVGANIGAPTEKMVQFANNVDFVGLFRTEFLYMENTHLPTEEEQFTAYRQVVEAYGKKPVTLRTIDIGGDKSIPYMDLPQEENPFLGVRALRLCYEQEHLLDTQLRAAMRASAYGTLQIMFPMVSRLEDIRWAKGKVKKMGETLDREGIPWDHDLLIGIMMEVPSIMMIADQVALEVDFASVGANDLCQYLMAADRLNPNVSNYYQSYHPANFRLIAYAVEQFKKHGKPISVCGELGGDPIGAPVLVGLGIEKLSMSNTSVARIKRELSGLAMEQMQGLAKRVLECGTQEAVQRLVNDMIRK